MSVSSQSTLSIDGHLWNRCYMSVLERCSSYLESTKRKKEGKRPTLGVHYRESTVILNNFIVQSFYLLIP